MVHISTKIIESRFYLKVEFIYDLDPIKFSRSFIHYQTFVIKRVTRMSKRLTYEFLVSHFLTFLHEVHLISFIFSHYNSMFITIAASKVC